MGSTGAVGPSGPAGRTGPAGPTGATGGSGAPGTNGNTILSGAGAPTADIGTVGDFYLDTDAFVIYGPKDSSGWPATGQSLIGPTGPTGPAQVTVTQTVTVTASGTP